MLENLMKTRQAYREDTDPWTRSMSVVTNEMIVDKRTVAGICSHIVHGSIWNAPISEPDADLGTWELSNNSSIAKTSTKWSRRCC
jgi:hypothetical protein